MDGDKIRHITVKKWQKHRKVEDCEKLTGPRWWTEDMSMPDILETQIDATLTQTWPDQNMEEPKEENLNEKKKADTHTGESPPSKKAKTDEPLSAKLTKTLSQDVVVDGHRGPGATHAINLGGQGNCGWRALAFGISQHNTGWKKSPNEIQTQIPTLAKSLQAKTVHHLLHKNLEWKKFWVKDEQATELTEGGTIPSSLKEFEKALAREGRWICGLCLEAVAEIQKVNIVVWRLEKGSWQRQFVFWGKGVYEKLPIVPVILSGGHYFGVQRNQPRQAFPEIWAKDSESVLVAQSVVDENINEISKGIRGGVASNKGCLIPRLIENKVEENPTTAHNHIELIAVNGFSTPIKAQPEQFEGEVGWLLRECTSHGGADLLRTCSAGGGSVKMASSIKKNGCIRWHCPVCDIALDVKKGQHAKITRHIHRMHHDYVAKNLEANRSCGYRSAKATSGIGIRDLMQPIKFTKVGPNAHFLCPFCDEGVATKPRSRHLLVMSKKAHLINDCKKVKKSLKRMPILKYTRMGWKKHGIQRPIWGERSKIIAERAKAKAV